MRIDLNYKKEGFSQIFPVLYITNDKEKAWIFGIGKKNIAFVTGENDDYQARKSDADVLSNYKKGGALDTNQKLLLAVLVPAAFLVIYSIIKKTKR